MVTIDQTDPSFAFTDSPDDLGWVMVQKGKAYGGSVMKTWGMGSFATVSFKGSSIKLYGTLHMGIDASVNIDDGDPTHLRQDIGTSTEFQQLLYTSPDLPYGAHELVVTEQSDEYSLVVDFVEVDETPPTSTTSELSTTTTVRLKTATVQKPSSSDTSSSTSRSETIIASATNSTQTSASFTSSELSQPSFSAASSSFMASIPSNTASPDPATSSSAPPQIHVIHASLSRGGIIGIAFAGSIILIILIAILILLLRLWRRHKNQHARINLHPYLITDATSPTTSLPSPDISQGSDGSRPRGKYTYGSEKQRSQFRLTESDDDVARYEEPVSRPQSFSDSQGSMGGYPQFMTMAVAGPSSVSDISVSTPTQSQVGETRINNEAVSSPSSLRGAAGSSADKSTNWRPSEELPPYPGSASSNRKLT